MDSNWALVILTGVLAILTSAYVIVTGKMAKAAANQADASMKMAEEMAEARLAAIRPSIAFKGLWITNPRPYCKADSGELPVPFVFATRFYNAGNGPATNIECKIAACGFDYASTSHHLILGTELIESGTSSAPSRYGFDTRHSTAQHRREAESYLERMDESQVEVFASGLSGTIKATYDDTYGNPYESLMDFEYDDDEGITLHNLRVRKLSKKGAHP